VSVGLGGRVVGVGCGKFKGGCRAKQTVNLPRSRGGRGGLQSWRLEAPPTPTGVDLVRGIFVFVGRPGQGESCSLFI